MGQRPSTLARVKGTWESLQFDQAVTMFGVIVENAANEMQEVGPKDYKHMVNRYELEQLLDPAFRLPAPLTAKQRERASIDALKTMARGNRSGVKVVKLP